MDVEIIACRRMPRRVHEVEAPQTTCTARGVMLYACRCENSKVPSMYGPICIHATAKPERRNARSWVDAAGGRMLHTHGPARAVLQ